MRSISTDDIYRVAFNLFSVFAHRGVCSKYNNSFSILQFRAQPCIWLWFWAQWLEESVAYVYKRDLFISREESLIDGIPLSAVKDRRKHGHKPPRPKGAGDNRLLLTKLKHLPGSNQSLISTRRFNQRQLIRVRQTVPGRLRACTLLKRYYMYLSICVRLQNEIFF